MPDDTKHLLDRLVGGDPAARGAVLVRAETDRSPAVLVAAALVAPDPHDLLARATTHATTTRDRQLVAIAAAAVAGDRDLLDALVRDHLADHPDNALAAWIAARHPLTSQEPAMTAPTTSYAQPAGRARRTPRRVAARWVVTFAGFPLGGLLANLLVGPVDSVPAAGLGGLLTGVVLGLVQAWGLALTGTAAVRWAVATSLGFGAGLVAGAAAVGYATTPAALVTQGALCGLAVGTAQTTALVPVLGRPALVWPFAVAAAWAVGWAVTTAVGVDVDEQFTVFGSSGALLVAVLTVVLPLALRRRSIPA